MISKTRKRAYRYLGNWGTGFFGPLLSTNVADQLFNVGFEFYQTVIVALLASSLQLGMLMSQDIKELSESK